MLLLLWTLTRDEQSYNCTDICIGVFLRVLFNVVIKSLYKTIHLLDFFFQQ